MKKHDIFSYMNTAGALIFKPPRLNTLPIHAQIEPTTFCNLKCVFCMRDKYIEKPVHMTLDQFKSIINSLSLKKLALNGSGEPFLNPDLISMIRFAKGRGISVSTVSNFTAVNRHLGDIIESGLDELRISIDGATPESYIKARRKDMFGSIIESLEALNALKHRLGSQTPRLRFQVVLTKDAYGEMEQIIELADRLQVSAISFKPVSTIHDENPKEKAETYLGQYREVEATRQKLKAIQKRLPRSIGSDIPVTLRRLDALWYSLYGVGKKTGKKQICYLPWFSVYILADGTVRLCCAMNYGDGNSDMGNVFREDFWDIWNNDRFQEVRRTARKGKLPRFKECAHCVPFDMFNIYSIIKNILPGLDL